MNYNNKASARNPVFWPLPLIAANGVTVEEYVEVFMGNHEQATISRETGRPITFGWTSTGKHIAVVWDEVQPEDPLIIRPVTAFETPPKKRKRR